MKNFNPEFYRILLYFIKTGEKRNEVEKLLYRAGIGRRAGKKNNSESGNSNNRGQFRNDLVLITYADSFYRIKSAGLKKFPANQEKFEKTLKTFYEFSGKYLADLFSHIHFLPFFPYSSDDGFSVIDYYKINKKFGSWKDVGKIKKNFSLMFDFVLNHISAESRWFNNYLQGKKGFEDFCIEKIKGQDYSNVVRPRNLPLFHPFRRRLFKKEKNENSDNKKTVEIWTTFSDDQIDINYDSVRNLKRMLDVFLFYLGKGAEIIRLDAIAYLWKKPGVSCIHLEQTHRFVEALRMIGEQVNKNLKILTETNVPHNENISYFGKKYPEAHMVYNFTLPPLLLYSFYKKDIALLVQWLKSVFPEKSQDKYLFFNFTASHDGIGLRPLEGIISENDFEWFVGKIKEKGGLVSYRGTRDGGKKPYEANITYVSALCPDKNMGQDSLTGEWGRRFVLSQVIMMILPGIPAIYINSLFGLKNWSSGVKTFGYNRAINRKKNDIRDLERMIAFSERKSGENYPGENTDDLYFSAMIYKSLGKVIKRIRSNPCFSSDAGFFPMAYDDHLLIIYRFYKNSSIIFMANFSDFTKRIDLNQIIRYISGSNPDIRPEYFAGSGKTEMDLEPYDYLIIDSV